MSDSEPRPHPSAAPRTHSKESHVEIATTKLSFLTCKGCTAAITHVGMELGRMPRLMTAVRMARADETGRLTRPRCSRAQSRGSRRVSAE